MDLSWSELLVVGIIALIFIGPKDLPGMFRELGRFAAKVRAMGREFSRAMEAAAKESGVKDVAADLKKVANPKAMGMDAVKSAADKFEKWDPLKPAAAKPAASSLTPPPMPATPTTAPAVAPSGPATSALAEKVAAKKAASVEKVAKLREAKAAPATAAAKPAAAEPAAAEAPAPKRGGRVRKKPAAGAGEDA
ncbi:twin-arginine translocase TatA/TatE family subunit [Tabrizicola sp.]|uniref:Sec-independent protein translocase subunit TatA/TatB n=1 Tax=Tabrizicola sp. TaxID=2005166 RepID=UPI00260424E8|nr:twin-arginine translocase TatA/TatE family subunit [Tabrizicola sp.]MDM7930321.1 twin-arginine translocase TatA/TatE family subunit [Tabrizicola sp.]